jgi:acyl-CoA synthetase (AMP-forming)/AMP-acid ligase II
VSQYLKGEEGSVLVDGWFPTGDVASIDADGFMQITDRAKDVVKSGGEWISSIDLENVAMAHPAVAMAACIAVPHPKWDERPMLVVVKKPGAEITRDELLAFYDGKVAKWWTPDDVAFVDAIPLGATGKMQKKELRERFKHHAGSAAWGIRESETGSRRGSPPSPPRVDGLYGEVVLYTALGVLIADALPYPRLSRAREPATPWSGMYGLADCP